MNGYGRHPVWKSSDFRFCHGDPVPFFSSFPSKIFDIILKKG
jgi:hypothetical protein